MVRKAAFTLLALLLLIAVLGGIKGWQISTLMAQAETAQPPAEAVTAGRVEVDEWQPAVSAVGTVTAVQGVTVTAEVAGVVRRIAFESGAMVEHGDLLIELDTDTEEAELAAAEARAALGRANLSRTRRLEQVGARAAADLDAAQAEAQQAAAQVRSIRAAIAKKLVRAPFAGRLGIRQVDVGEFIEAGTPIVSLQSFDPIYVNFALPQRWLARLEPGQQVEVRADADEGQGFAGELTTINPDVNPQTRNVQVQATLPNPEGRLRPGMFVDAQVVFPERERVLIVPLTAVVFAPYGNSVFLIETRRDERGDEVHVARQQFVRLGETRGDFVAVESGLTAGQRVVTSGAFKLQSGSRLDIRDELEPDAQLEPDPSEL